MTVKDESVNRLLHDAIRKVGGAEFAAQMGDRVNARELLMEAAKLFAQAITADPDGKDASWGL